MVTNPFKAGDWAQVKGAISFKPQRVKKVDGPWISFDGTLWAHYSEYLKVEGNFKPDAEMVIATPFPDPERWAQHEGWVDFVKFSSKESKGFCAASEIGSASAVNQHNTEIDQLMSEIRRLEALVQK
jgi:hypothetical protein